MNKYFYFYSRYTLILFGLIFNYCNGQEKKDVPQEKDHPKLIKTIGSPRYGNVQCILQDKEGNLWFGTTENGLYKYDAKSAPTGHAEFNQFLVADGLYSNSVYSLLEDKEGKIWIGTQEGLCLYDPAASIKPGDKTFSKIKLPLPPNPAPNKDDPYYSSNWVYSIMQAKSGKLWFVTRGGVYIYDAEGFTTFSINDASNGKLTVDFKPERILEDKEGYIWFGGRTNEGVYRYDARLPVGQGKSITHFKLEDLFQDGPKPKAHHWAWPQLQDKNGNIWFSNWGGAYRYDARLSSDAGTDGNDDVGQRKSFTSFTKKDGLPGGVTQIIEDKKGNLWFGGDAGAGLSRYDTRQPARAGTDGNDKGGQGHSFTSFTTNDGLLNHSIWSILEDRNGNIWVGTRETGLYVYDASLPDGHGKKFITYSEYKQ